MTASSGLAGVLLVDKPVGPTSHDVVERARRCLDERRIGHTGTLDPFATGLLVLCVGRATRLVEYFHLLPKRYRATLRLGVETTTHDPEGEPVEGRGEESWRRLEREDVERAAVRFTGRIRQVPPAFSAKRLEGRRAHEAARAGERVELEPVEVTVHELTVLGMELPEVRVEALVSTGTYVRSLARDLGRKLGCGAHLTALRRTDVGPLCVDDAVPAAELAEGTGVPGPPAWLDPAGALSFLPRAELTAEEGRRAAHGQRVPVRSVEGPGLPASLLSGPEEGQELPVALVRGRELVAVAERAGGELQPRKVFSRA